MDTVLDTLNEIELKKRKKDLQIQVKKINILLKNMNNKNDIIYTEPKIKKIVLKKT
jgi:hypothetical protein